MVDMKLGVLGGADGLAVGAQGSVYGCRQCKRGCLDRGVLPIG